ncbi:thioredoxin domain-containing protein [uncultured Sphingomonas sp.]|uniref:thioredoxin domain-containing protein n=1 Tax=uncultured Sphingomonas sp. TaxID=158754 RepID=UPI0035CA7992
MMGRYCRLLLILIGFAALTAAAPVRDWRAHVVKLPSGAYVVGNPAARVKLVEYASYTCPHCAAFVAESEPVLLRQMVRSGSTSWEFRNLIRDRIDLSAAVLAHCAPPAGFVALNGAIFAQQPGWLDRAMDFQQANGARLQMYPTLAQLRAYADGAGLTAIGRSHGLSDARIDACYADQAELDRITAMTAAVPVGVVGTPAFVVNGKLVTGANWATLQPALVATGAK